MRTIYFGARQVLWDCGHSRACETYPLLPQTNIPSRQNKVSLKMPHSFHEKQRLLYDYELESIGSAISEARMFPEGANESIWSYREDLSGIWPRFVSHYSLRRLTFPVDKLLAIAGVARLLSGAMQDRYVAGLWESNLMDGLLWYIRPNTITTQPLKYRAPSWSWASCEGYVLHAENFDFSWTVARALNWSCDTTTGDEFGIVTSAHMILQAYCLHLNKDKDDAWTISNRNNQSPRLTIRLDTSEDTTSLREIYGAIIRTTAYRLTDTMQTWDTPADPSKGKILLAAQGILLTPGSTTKAESPGDLSSPDDNTTEARGETNFRRVGWFSLEDRRSGSLRPKWVVPGLEIFHEPVPQHERSEEGLDEFPFEQQRDVMSILHIV